MITEDEKREALEAASLLQSRLLKRTFEQIEEATLRQWINSDNIEKREDAWHTITILKKVRSRLHSLLVTAAQKEGTGSVFVELQKKLS